METRRDVFQAIADPTRRQILGMLIQDSQNVNAIAQNFDMSRQAVSLHVKILSECGVISMRKEGRERHYRLEPNKLLEINDWLEPFRKTWEARFEKLDHLLIDIQTKTTNK